MRHKRFLFYIGVTIWGTIIAIAVVFFFFPYQKVFKLAFQNMLSGGKVGISLVGVEIKATQAQASRVIVWHDALEGKPIFELDDATLTWNPFSIFRGSLCISSRALAYGGTVLFRIADIPVVSGGNPKLTINFSGVDLSRYPEGTLPWFKRISGTMEGWIQKELMPLAPEKEKGSFKISLKDGELTEVYLSSLPKLIVPFNDVRIEGKIDGNKFYIDNAFIRDASLLIKGKGYVQTGEVDQKIDFKVSYEGISKNKAFFGKGFVAIVGPLWSPDIKIVPEQQRPVPAK